MTNGELKLTQTVDELLAQHPLPWTHHLLLIKDADGRQVIHTGGLYNERGALHEGAYLSGLNALLVELVNSRDTTPPAGPVVARARAAAEEIVTWTAQIFPFGSGLPRETRVARVLAIITRHFAATPPIPELTEEDAQLAIGAIPLQALPETPVGGEPEFGDLLVAAVNAVKAVMEYRGHAALEMLNAYFVAPVPAAGDDEGEESK